VERQRPRAGVMAMDTALVDLPRRFPSRESVEAKGRRYLIDARVTVVRVDASSLEVPLSVR
jgi:hypothetical protein